MVEDKAGVGVDHLHGVGAVAGDDDDFGGLFGVKANALRRAFEAQQERQRPKAHRVLEEDGVVGGESEIVQESKAREDVAVLAKGVACGV